MNLQLTLTLLISKLTMVLCRLLRLGGTNLPGGVALKLYPDTIRSILKNKKLVMVTGTNGKTTTTRIISQMFNECGISYISNKSGANLVSGIASTLIEAADWKGRLNESTALIEIDEAAFNKITDHVSPDILVITNFFRDQLDRYGELYSALKSVQSGIRKSPQAALILNADDSLCVSLKQDVPNPVLYYSLKDPEFKGMLESVNADAMFCIFCKTKYEYDSHTYGHLGSFRCPGCGFHQPEADVVCSKINALTSSHSEVEITMMKQGSSGQNAPSPEYAYPARISLPGLYNVYNALAAIACAFEMKLPPEHVKKAVASFESGFGRMETIHVDGRELKIILVKNPTGFNQVLNFLCIEENPIRLAFLINDKAADGRDISWLWDVDFEKLLDIQPRIGRIYTSGLRAEDMSVRLKYAGIDMDKIRRIKDYEVLLMEAVSQLSEGETLYLLPTYTAMFELRRLLAKKYHLKDFWR